MSKDNLINIKLAQEEVDIKGEKYIVKEMTAGEASNYESDLFSMVNGKPVYNTKNAKAKLVLSVLYQDDVKVFEPKDLSLLEKMPSSILNKLFDVASKLNNLGQSEKNSEATQPE